MEWFDNVRFQRYREMPDQQHRLKPSPGAQSTPEHRWGVRIVLLIVGALVAIVAAMLLLDPGPSDEPFRGEPGIVTVTTGS